MTVLDHELRALDVNTLNRRGLFARADQEDWSELRWPSGASIRIAFKSGSVFVAYSATSPGADNAEEIGERIGIAWTSCNFGGQRPWFVCPDCDRRCGKLYGGRLFRCRLCVELVYGSTRQPEWERLLERAQDIRARLGGSMSTAAPFPLKPKGMHQRTYDRLRWESETMATDALLLGLASCR